MKFKKEVQELFKKAGWYEGRNVKEVFDKVSRFNEYPELLKEFLYEYGDLKVETDTEFAKGILDFTVVSSGFYEIEESLDNPRYYGNIITFPLADYHLDSASLECDSEGRVYMVGDFPTLMSEDFKTGIEKAIMEDYSDTKEWHPDVKEWKEEPY